VGPDVASKMAENSPYGSGPDFSEGRIDPETVLHVVAPVCSLSPMTIP